MKYLIFCFLLVSPQAFSAQRIQCDFQKDFKPVALKTRSGEVTSLYGIYLTNQKHFEKLKVDNQLTASIGVPDMGGSNLNGIGTTLSVDVRDQSDKVVSMSIGAIGPLVGIAPVSGGFTYDGTYYSFSCKASYEATTSFNAY